MKIYSIIISFLLIGIIKTSSDPIALDLFTEKAIDEQGLTYFYCPIYEIDRMKIIVNFYDLAVSAGGINVDVAGFTNKPSYQEMSTAIWTQLTGYYIYGQEQQTNYGFSAYRYDFSLAPGVNYLGIQIYSTYNKKATLYVKSLNHVYTVQLLDEISIKDCLDGYYFKIPAFSEDKMSIDARVYRPYYSKAFSVFIKGLGSSVTDNDIRANSNWIQLTEYNYEEGTSYDLYSYPFETIEGVANLGFWFQCPFHDQVVIRIYSEAATKIAIILLAIFIPLIIIGAGIGFLFKRGCFCRIRVG